MIASSQLIHAKYMPVQISHTHILFRNGVNVDLVDPIRTGVFQYVAAVAALFPPSPDSGCQVHAFT